MAESTEEGQAATEPEAARPRRRNWDLSWMEVPTERGVRPEIGPEGLTLAAINVGSYGEVPEIWPYHNDMPRGSVSIVEATLNVPTLLDEKADVWAESAAALYEQAIRERWAAATDLPWSALAPLSGVEERAVCQLCTELSEQALLTQQVIGRWLERISYGFHEVKMCLATQVFDAGRHVEAFRKRALANGGGLGLESPGFYNRGVNDVLSFTELAIYLHIVRDGLTLGLLEQGESLARNDLERSLYRQVAQDLARHVAFGVDHVGFHLARRPEKRAQLNLFIGRAEDLYLVDAQHDTPFTAALRLLAASGGGPDAPTGLRRIREQQTVHYLDLLEAAGLAERRERSAAFVAGLLDV